MAKKTKKQLEEAKLVEDQQIIDAIDEKEVEDKGFVDTTPQSKLHRSDKIQYWLAQKNAPASGTPTYKNRLTMFDKMVIGMINAAESGNAASANWVMNNGFGSQYDNADLSGGEEGYEVDFGVSNNTMKDED